MKAEQALSKVEAFLKPSDREPDPESITDEERFMFRKLGFKMKAFLLLGKARLPSLLLLNKWYHLILDGNLLLQVGVEFSMVQLRICICIGSTGS